MALAETIMNKIPMMLALVLTLSATATATATAASLNGREVAQLKSEIASMYDDFERGDAKQLLAATHDSLYKLAGGKEALEKATQTAVEQLLSSGVKFMSSELGMPTETYMAGDEEVCFVPRVSVMEIQGRRAKSTGFMIAIRKVGSNDWKYLDGSGLRKNPENLYLLLPKLKRGIELPPNSMELL
jgi:hypothetical protein